MGNGFNDFNEFSGIVEGEMMSDEMLGVMAGVIGILLVVGLLALVLGIVSYVLSSVATHTIAKRRGIKHAWLAWLPVGNSWIMGSISDQYQYVAKGRVRNTRKVLLGLSIAAVVLSFWSQSNSNAAFQELLTYVEGGTVDATATAMNTGVGFLLRLVTWGVGVASAVFGYIALYHLYMSCNPNNGVLFLVLSIIFGITQPFFLFACRNKDLGMPPRKPEPQWQPIEQAQPAWQPNGEAQCRHAPGSPEPWENPPEE